MKDVKLVVIVFTYLFFHISISYERSYNLTCPSQANWKIRAKSRCNITSKYFCLYNDVEGLYVEGCKGPDWDRKGSKRIFSGSFTRGQCIQRRYQPFTFWTNGSTSDCIYDKSLCIEEGQTVYKEDSTKDDRTCRCDYNKSYSFINTPRHISYCIPSEEDCSCFIKSCTVNLTLSEDYVCIQSGYPQNQSGLDNKHYEPGDETTQVQMEKNNFQLRETHFNLELIFLTPASVLIGFCILLLIVSGGFSLVFHKTAIEKFQPVRNFPRTHTGPNADAGGVESERSVSTDVNHESCESTSVDEEAIEEENFLRMIHLLFRVACPAVRMKLNHEINPDELRKSLDNSKPEMKKKYRDKENIINNYQWDLLYKGSTVTSDNFDIRLMIYLLRTLANICIDDVYPVQSDTSYSAMLSRIKFIRNEALRRFEGKPTKDKFNQYWSDIGQAVLKLVSQHKIHIGIDQEKIRLFGRLLVLNPIHINNTKLCKFIDMSDKYPAMILQQIICEYCTLNELTIENVLKKEQHELYHKRFQTESCCICAKHVDSSYAYIKVIPETQWETLYELNKSTSSHTCGVKSGPCCEHFIPKSIDLSRLTECMPLVLYAKNMINHIMSRLCENRFNEFLTENKHTIYHNIEDKRSCKFDKIPPVFLDKNITEIEWDTLFVKNDKTICKSDTHDCSWQYSVKKEIKYSDIAETIVSKIFSVSGPISLLNKMKDNAFLYYINWTIDDMPLFKALTDLLRIVDDKEFCQKVSSLIQPEIDRTIVVKPIANHSDACKWVSTHMQQKKASTERQLHVIVPDEDEVNIKSVTIPKDFCLPHRTKNFEDITKEENYFLVVVYGLTKFVYPVIQNEFNTHCDDSELKKVSTNLYDQLHEKCTEDCGDTIKNRKKIIYLTQDQQNQLFLPSEKGSRKIDLKLMIYILKKITEDKMKKDYVEQLDVIDDIKREIVQSSSGMLDNKQFKDYLTRLQKAVQHLHDLGGENYTIEMEELSVLLKAKQIIS